MTDEFILVQDFTLDSFLVILTTDANRLEIIAEYNIEAHKTLT